MTDTDQPLRVAEELLVLERGHDELLLANNIEPRPLYVKQGGQYIKRFLQAVGELGTQAKIARAYPQDKHLLDVMLDYGIVVPQGAERQGKLLERRNCGKKASISLYLLISESCNMRCVYCLDGQRTHASGPSSMMSKEVAFKSVERCFDDLQAGGRLEVIFFGGEPLLNWPLAKEVIIHCESLRSGQHAGKRLTYHVASNLSILPADLIEWAKRYDISFLCDVDGPLVIHDLSRPFRDGRGTHESVVGNIRRISAAGLKVSLRSTITSLNQDCLVETAEHHREIGGQSSGFCAVHPVNTDGGILPQHLLPSPEKVVQGLTSVYRSKLWQEWQLYPFNVSAQRLTESSMAAVGCGAAGGSVPAVAANGDVYPCTYLVGMKKFHLGNIMDATFPKNDVLDRMFDELHVDHREDCRQCSWRYLCGGGCPVGRLLVSDNPAAGMEVKSYCQKMNCDFTKSIFEALLWERATASASTGTEEAVPGPKCL